MSLLVSTLLFLSVLTLIHKGKHQIYLPGLLLWVEYSEYLMKVQWIHRFLCM